MKNKRIRNDIILIAAVILIAAIVLTALVLINNAKSSKNISEKNVIVYLDGSLYGKYPLSVDKSVEIISERGRNLLVISDGKASISEASCPDLVCVKHRAISGGLDQIICLPNKLVVTIE